VTDHGPGIPTENIDKIFDKFVQIQLRNAGHATGSGLGLAFCKLAVNAQSGQIWVENTPSNGASVLFTLPASDGL